MAVDIYEYLDYRKLLRDLYEENKKEKPFFSYRYIAQKVGFSSPGFLTNILNGKRNISQETAFQFARLFKFNKTQTEYFDLLVQYNQAKNHDRQRHYFEKILSSKRSKVRVVDATLYEFYSKWFYTAVREVLNVYYFYGNTDSDYKELGRRIAPPIPASDAKKAIVFLEKSDFIKRAPEGHYVQSEPFISTGYEAKSLAVHNFIKATADLAKEAIDRFPRDRRRMATLTVGLSKEGFEAVEEKLKAFNREVFEIVKADTGRDTIYHFNFHIFPISRPGDDKHR